MPRDEFSEQIKRIVAERAGYICSNPDCRRPTVGPHTDPKKSLKTGEACHIRAAAPGGPRYEPEQSGEERGGIDNAIWLCTECSTRIDRDSGAYSVDTIRLWKRTTEDWARDGGIEPVLPKLVLKKLDGRTLSDLPGTITAVDCEVTREHLLTFENVSGDDVWGIDARVQLPEPIIESNVLDRPAGIEVIWRPLRVPMVVRITGGGSVTRGRPPLATNVYRLQIERLPPSHRVAIAFVTSLKSWEDHDFSMTGGMWESLHAPPNLAYFIDGTFQFRYRGVSLVKRFFAPLEYQQDTRSIVILEVREDTGRWEPVIINDFS